jgi:hypothetical protein
MSSRPVSASIVPAAPPLAPELGRPRRFRGCVDDDQVAWVGPGVIAAGESNRSSYNDVGDDIPFPLEYSDSCNLYDCAGVNPGLRRVLGRVCDV